MARSIGTLGRRKTCVSYKFGSGLASHFWGQAPGKLVAKEFRVLAAVLLHLQMPKLSSEGMLVPWKMNLPQQLQMQLLSKNKWPLRIFQSTRYAIAVPLHPYQLLPLERLKIAAASCCKMRPSGQRLTVLPRGFSSGYYAGPSAFPTMSDSIGALLHPPVWQQFK